MTDRDIYPGDSEYDRLKDRGFLPGESVFMFSPGFTLDELKEAQYGSTYADPKPLRIELAKDIVFHVVVQTVTAAYEGFEHAVADNPLGCYLHPRWKVEGWLLKSGFDPYGEVVRYYMYLMTGADGRLEDESLIQRVPKESEPNAPFRHIEDA